MELLKSSVDFTNGRQILTILNSEEGMTCFWATVLDINDDKILLDSEDERKWYDINEQTIFAGSS
jgi:hypothetical protein